MDNEEYLACLKQDVIAFNEWRKKNPRIRLILKGADLSGADLREAKLVGADLREAKLVGAKLREAKLVGAKLREADLRGTDLRGRNLSEPNRITWVHPNMLSEADLSGTDLRGADLRAADLREADLSEADLSEADLLGADLRAANLSGTDLRAANLSGTDLREADLSGMNLRGRDLSGADLSNAKLRLAQLSEASFIDAHLDNAMLTGAILWETQRAGWSIKGVKCEYAFFDRDGKQATHFTAGEFEKLYAEKTKIVLHYERGISPIEVLTMPALIQRLEKSYEGCSLRLQSVQDDAGGATAIIVVDNLGQHNLASLRTYAEEVQQLQLRLRHEEKLRLQLQAQIDLMTEKLFPIMLERTMGDTYNVNTAYGPVGPKGRITQQTIYNQNDLATIRKLVEDTRAKQASLEQTISSEKYSEIQNSLDVLRAQLTVQAPDHSIIRSTLKSLKTIFEGATGSVVASGWLELLQRLD